MATNRVDYFGETLIDITDSTVTEAVLNEGIKAYGSDGNPIIGTQKILTSEAQYLSSSNRIFYGTTLGTPIGITEYTPQDGDIFFLI